MKKTIILTFLLLILSLVSDLFVLKNMSNLGGLMSHSFAEKSISNLSKNDSIKYVAMESNNLHKQINVEYVEEKILYKQVIGTVYHAVKGQTDDSPLLTADNSLIDTTRVNELRWVALSRDLLKRRYTDPSGKKHVWSGKIKLGDTIWVDYDKNMLWKLSKGNVKKYEKMKAKYELVKGYWIVHDVMGSQYTKRTRNGKYILDENGKKQVVKINNAIDFLQHPSGMMEVWNRGIIISKRKINYITVDASQQLATLK